jgi:predicted TPR repeat methyltransferase
MVKTHPRTFHVGVDPSHVRSLITRLTAQYSVAILDGGCDTGLLGDGWYILDYFG